MLSHHYLTAWCRQVSQNLLTCVSQLSHICFTVVPTFISQSSHNHLPFILIILQSQLFQLSHNYLTIHYLQLFHHYLTIISQLSYNYLNYLNYLTIIISQLFQISRNYLTVISIISIISR